MNEFDELTDFIKEEVKKQEEGIAPEIDKDSEAEVIKKLTEKKPVTK